MNTAHEPVQLKRSKMGLHKLIAAASEPNTRIGSIPTLVDLRARLLDTKRQVSDAETAEEPSLDSYCANQI
jgi:hypothetical protein